MTPLGSSTSARCDRLCGSQLGCSEQPAQPVVVQSYDQMEHFNDLLFKAFLCLCFTQVYSAYEKLYTQMFEHFMKF